MSLPLRFALGLLGLVPLVGRSEPESELREALQALARTSYRWETTVRQRFNADNHTPRLDSKAAIETEGRHDPDGYTEITVKAPREVGVPVTVVFRGGDVVARTPLGWKRRTEIRQTPGPDREVEIEGKKVKLSRYFGAALKASALRPVAEDLFDLTDDLKACRSESGLIVAELKDKAVERLWGDANARRAPEIHGTVIFKLAEQGIAEFHVVLGIGFPNSRTQKVAWTMQQWTTRLTGLGSTVVDPPEGAVKALQD